MVVGLLVALRRRRYMPGEEEMGGLLFGLLPRSFDSPDRLDRPEEADGALGFSCLGFLTSLLLRFWPLAMPSPPFCRKPSAVLAGFGRSALAE